RSRVSCIVSRRRTLQRVPPARPQQPPCSALPTVWSLWQIGLISFFQRLALRTACTPRPRYSPLFLPHPPAHARDPIERLVRRGHTPIAASPSARAALLNAIRSRHLPPRTKYAAGSSKRELRSRHEA